MPPVVSGCPLTLIFAPNGFAWSAAKSWRTVRPSVASGFSLSLLTKMVNLAASSTDTPLTLCLSRRILGFTIFSVRSSSVRPGL